MALRTFQLTGQAYSVTGDVSVLAKFNGVTVHDGIVPTTVSAEPDQSTARDVMIEFDLEDTIYNTVVPSSFVVSGGTFIVAGIKANNLFFSGGSNGRSDSKLDRLSSSTEKVNLAESSG